MRSRRHWIRFFLPATGIITWFALVLRWVRHPETITPSAILLGVIAAFCALTGLLLLDRRRS
jgi:hypothetical protein